LRNDVDLSKPRDHKNSVASAPSAAKTGGKRGLWRVIINPDMCKGCNICIEFCPTKVFETSETLSRRGYYLPLVSHEEACTGCRVCDLLCPELAIIIESKSAPEEAE